MNYCLLFLAVLHLYIGKIHEYEFSEVSNNTMIDCSENQSIKPKRKKFNIKYRNKYSKVFITQFIESFGYYNHVDLLDDTIIINHDRKNLIIIPTDLPINQALNYRSFKDNSLLSLVVKRINISTIEYSYSELINRKERYSYRGYAHLQPTFYLGAQGDFEAKNGITYGMNEYIDLSHKNREATILIGVGNIEISAFIIYDENRNKSYSAPNLRLK